MQKKVLFVIENLNAGGAERVFANLLKGFNRKKFKIKLILFNDGKNSEKGIYSIPSDIETIILNRNKKAAFLPLLSVIKKERPDIVFSNLAPVNILCLLCKLFIRNKKVKFIIRETTIKSVSINTTKTNLFSRFLYKLLIKLLYNYADLIISLSYGARKDLVENLIASSNLRFFIRPLPALPQNKEK